MDDVSHAGVLLFRFQRLFGRFELLLFHSLLFSALTMWYLRRTIDEKKLLEKLEKNYQANKEKPKKMSGLAARLEALQKQQEEMMKLQQERQKHKK